MAENLLIIDDDAHMRESLSEVLELNGFSCHQAPTAKTGLDLAKKFNPDAVIMDIQLPDFSGFQICQELRLRSKSVVLIMMTGRFLSAEERRQGFELGADDYLTKPFDPSELTARLRQLLSRQS